MNTTVSKWRLLKKNNCRFPNLTHYSYWIKLMIIGIHVKVSNIKVTYLFENSQLIKTGGHTNKPITNMFVLIFSETLRLSKSSSNWMKNILDLLFLNSSKVRFNDVSGLATSQEIQKWTVDLWRCLIPLLSAKGDRVQLISS